ncbi:MAG: DUF2971 domain-containing protein [Candidatus Eisenbacteria bacterium]
MTESRENRGRETTSGDREIIVGWRQRIGNLTHLYKYKDISGTGRRHLSEMFQDRALYFPTYADLNDPFDSNFTLHFDATDEEKRAHWDEVLPTDHPDRSSEIARRLALSNDKAEMERRQLETRAMLSKYGVCCLTEKPDNILMWSYYAGGHAGVCLRFRTVDLFHSYGKAPGVLVPVEYAKSYPRLGFFEPGIARIFSASVGTKSSAWEHEAEWRIVRPDMRGSLPCDPFALDGVVLGCNISKKDEVFVRNLAASASVPVVRAPKRAHDYGIDVAWPP